MIVFEIIYFLGLFLSGYLLISIIQTNPNGTSYIAAFPFGTIVWFSCYLFTNLVWIDVEESSTRSIVTMSLFMVINLLFLFFIKKRFFNIKQLIHLSLVFIIIVIYVVLINYLKPVNLTNDSVYYLIPDMDIREMLRIGLPVFNLSFQFITLLVHYDHILVNHVGLFNLSLIALWFLFSYKLINSNEHSKGLLMLAVMLPILIFYSTFIGIYNFSYLNHHIIFAFFILNATFGVYIYDVKAIKEFLVYAFISLLPIAFLRMEGLLYVVLWLVHFINIQSVKKKDGLKFIFSYIFLFSFWVYFKVDKFIGFDTFVQWEQYLAIFVLLMLAGFYYSVKDKIYLLKKYNPYFSQVITISLLLIIVFTFLIKPDHMLLNLRSTIINLFYKNSGGWGVLWFIFLPVSGYLSLKHTFGKKEGFISQLFFFFLNSVLLSFALSFFRTPFNPYMFDSFNRMLIHFFPFLAIWVIFYISAVFFQEKNVIKNA